MMTDDEYKIITYPYDKVVIEFGDSFKEAKRNIEKNTELPTIDVDALMDYLLDIIQTDEAYSSSSREGDIDYLLEQTIRVGEFSPRMVEVLKSCIDTMITSILSNLHRTGLFINGLQPYNFLSFIDDKTAILIQSKVFSYRDEKYPPMDSTPRRDFIL